MDLNDAAEECTITCAEAMDKAFDVKFAKKWFERKPKDWPHIELPRWLGFGLDAVTCMSKKTSLALKVSEAQLAKCFEALLPEGLKPLLIEAAVAASATTQIASLQTALAADGRLVGPIDGRWGRSTARALGQFQSGHGLAGAGVVTLPALKSLGLAHTLQEQLGAPWLATLHQWRHDLASSGSDAPVAALPARISSAASRWSASVLGQVLATVLPDERLPIEPFAPESWRALGIPSPAVPGAIVVIPIGRGSALAGVISSISPASDEVQVLGGIAVGQIAEVTVSRDRLHAIRWPATSPIVT
jgi:peptidoglycan hydrolase-like protein with peptidoglycan-binding domain